MESLSSVRTIIGIAQDILSAVETASRNKSRCEKVASRVRCIKDILAALDAAQDETAAATTEDAATRILLDRLEEVLGRALQVVRRCQRSGLFRSVIVAGGRIADPLDAVEGEIDRCMLDLAVANSLRIARLETLVRQQQQQHDVAASEKDENKRGEGSAKGVTDKKAHLQLQVPEVGRVNTTAAAAEEIAAIGVPVCTVTAAAVHEVVPPPCYGYGYGGYYGYRRYGGYWRNHGWAACCDSWADSAGGPSDAALYYHTQYSSGPSMFSDEDPNSCTIL